MLRRGGGAGGKKVAKKAGSAGPSFLASLKAAKDPQSIQALVHKLKDGPQSSRAFDEAAAYTFEEIQKVLPTIATKHDDESTLRARVGLTALAMFAMEDKAAEEFIERLQEIMDSAVYEVLDHEDPTGVALPLQVSAFFLATKIAQAIEDQAEDFVDKLMDFFVKKIKFYQEALTKAGEAGLAKDTTEHWRAFFMQSAEYIVTIVSINAEAIAPHCLKFFPTACALLPLSPLKAELMDIIGHTSMMAIKPVIDEAGEESDDEDEDDEEDEEEEKEHGADFLEQKLLMAQLHGDEAGGPTAEPAFVVTPQDLPYETLKAVTVECVKIFELWFSTGNDDYESGSAILGVTAALSAQRYSEEQHIEIMGLALPPLIAKMNGAAGNVDWPKMREVVIATRDVLRHALPKAFRPNFQGLFESMKKLQVTAKEWIKAQAAKKNRKVYNSFRAAMLKTFGAVLRKDPESTATVATNFLSEVAPIFADPMILAEFVGALGQVQGNDALKADLKDKYLPDVMKQLLGELRKDNISKYVRELIIDSVSRVGLKVGALFEPYFEEAHKLLVKCIELEDNEYAEKSINGIAMLFEGCKSKNDLLKKAVPGTLQELEKIIKLEVDLSKMLAGAEEDSEDDEEDEDAAAAKFGFGAKKAGGPAGAGPKGGFGLKAAAGDEEDEEDEEFEDGMGGVDIVVRLQHKALLALQFFCKEDELTEALVAGAGEGKLVELFNTLIEKVAAVSFFDDDFMLKIPQVAILSTLFEKVPALRTADNKKRLVEAFGKLDVDFDELQDAMEKLEKLQL